ncbi:hypothetical protein NDU88_000921 [Pleurodeles waltl]|uniref:Uncharacterized protein n=1 Tax=Pleurodeles waltl TaxID=8319 RepID=A0AAV7KNY1_PLEWA|nr:hypothetical protein NDU88_000921 [Pleurodeles waltl]
MGVDSILDCFLSAIGFGRVPIRSVFRFGKFVRYRKNLTVLFAFGAPPPAGYGLTQKIGDRPSAPKKGTHVSRSSDSGRDTGTEKIRPRDTGSGQFRHRDTGTETTQHRDIGTPKHKKVALELKKTVEKVSIPKHPASEPKSSSYTEEQGVSSQMQGHKFGQELEAGKPDYTQRRLHIQKETGKIRTLPPIRMKRKLAFQEKVKQP